MEQLKKRKKLWYAAFLFLFILIALEVTGRIYEHVPNFKEGDENGYWIEINKQGFRRSSDVAMLKPKKTLRIFLMGASAAHGISSSAPFPIRHIYNKETIDAFLEKLLKNALQDKNIEVINAAVTGYQFFQQTNYLMSEIVQYNPDMVIFFDGANDCYISNPAYNYFDGNKFQFWKTRLQQPSLSGVFDYSMLWCSKFSAFARGYLSWKGIKEAENVASENPVYTISNNVGVTVNNHQQIALKTWLPVLQTNFNILRQHQIKTAFVLQPMLALRNQKLLSQTEINFCFADQNCVDVYSNVTRQLDSICAVSHITYFDCNSFFNDSLLKGQQLFIDYCHLTPSANKVVAEKLFLEIKKQLTD